MKIAISNIAWSPINRIKIYSFLKKNDIKNIEIAPKLFLYNQKNYLRPNKKLLLTKFKELKKFKLKIVSMQSLFYESKNCELFTSIQKRQNFYNQFKRIIKLAGILKIPNLVFGSPKNRIIPNNVSKIKAEKIAIKIFKKLGDYAYKNNTKISIESNPEIYGTNFLNNIYETCDFVKKVNHKSIRIVLDTGELLVNKNFKDIKKIVQLTRKYIYHVHISQPSLKPINNNKMIISVLKELKKINYTRCVSIEMKNPGDAKTSLIIKSLNNLIRYRRLI